MTVKTSCLQKVAWYSVSQKHEFIAWACINVVRSLQSLTLDTHLRFLWTVSSGLCLSGAVMAKCDCAV